jgi:hypothetical protein
MSPEQVEMVPRTGLKGERLGGTLPQVHADHQNSDRAETKAQLAAVTISVLIFMCFAYIERRVVYVCVTGLLKHERERLSP